MPNPQSMHRPDPAGRPRRGYRAPRPMRDLGVGALRASAAPIAGVPAPAIGARLPRSAPSPARHRSPARFRRLHRRRRHP